MKPHIREQGYKCPRTLSEAFGPYEWHSLVPVATQPRGPRLWVILLIAAAVVSVCYSMK